MMLHHLKLSLRLFMRNSFFTGINLVSLSVGFCAFLILWPYANKELNSDRWHRDSDRIARLSTHFEWTDDNVNWNGWYTGDNMAGTGNMIKENFRQVEALTRFIPQAGFKRNIQGSGPKVICSVTDSVEGKKVFSEKRLAYADQNFFEFFSFPLILGEPAKVLGTPYSAVMSESSAQKYFGQRDPRGRTIYLNDSLPLTVTGVFRDLPENTHLAFDIVISTAGAKTLNDVPSFDWMGYNYVRLQNNDLTEFSRELDARHAEIFGTLPPNIRPSIYVQPLTGIVFERLRGGNGTIKSRTPLMLLRLMSFVILILAWGNYISLSFNRINQRLTELGTRKAVGASMINFAKQFFTEAAVINLVAFLLALTLAQLAARVTHLFGFYIVRLGDLPVESILVITGILLLGIILTGIYPVWIASKYKSLDLLKKLKTSRRPAWLTGIVTFQYSAAMIMIVWIVIMHVQLDYILNRDIGVNKESVIVVNCPVKQDGNFESRLAPFMNAVRNLSGVQSVSMSHDLPGDGTGNLYVQRNAGANGMALDINGGVDENFIPLLGIKLIAGRNFSSGNIANENHVLISDAAVHRLGLDDPATAIGMKLTLPNHPGADVEVIGVYREYEFRPFLTGQREEGRGSILTYKHRRVADFTPGKVLIKVDMQQHRSVIDATAKQFARSFDEPFESSFLDENIQKHYQTEMAARNQIGLFTGLAIFIACLGLFGMITNRVTEKTKEIGIRKVLGARMRDITAVLVRATVFQVVFAVLAGVPVAYYLVTLYLEKFSERISLQWWHFVVPVSMLLIIMAVTILSVLVKASGKKAVDSLRYE